MSVCFEALPSEIHAKILNYLSPIERFPIATLSDYWGYIAFKKCKKIVFLEDNRLQWHCESARLLYSDYCIFSVKSWQQIADVIHVVGKITSITHLALYKCKFSESNNFHAALNIQKPGLERTWKNIGDKLPHLETLFLRNTKLKVAWVKELVSRTHLLENLELVQHPSQHRGQAEILNDIFSRNQLRTLKLYDEVNEYHTLPLKKLHSVYLSLYQSDSREFSQSIAAVGVKQLSTKFENLRELQLSGMNEGLLKLLGGENDFPRLKVLALHTAGFILDVAQFPCIFNQNATLEVLNVDLTFICEESTLKIANRYKQLKFLRYNFFGSISKTITEAIINLSQLRCLVWCDSLYPIAKIRLEIADQLLSEVIASLPKLRFLCFEYLNLKDYPLTQKVLHYVASKNTEKQYIIDAMDLGDIHELINVHSLNDSRAHYLLSSWQKPNRLLSFLEFGKSALNFSRHSCARSLKRICQR